MDIKSTQVSAFQTKLSSEMQRMSRHATTNTKEAVTSRTPSNQAQTTPEMKRLFPGLYDGKASTANISAKQDIKSEIKNDPERKRLYGAAKDFQAIFIGHMLKAMRKNLNPKNDPLYGGNREDIFKDMLFDEYSKKMSASSGFTLADQIYKQTSGSLGPKKIHQAVEQGNSTHKYIPGQSAAEQKYSADRLRREIEQSHNRLSTSELFKEEDWQP